MFKTISRLFFGGVEETPEDVKSGEVGEEGWHVVTHQEADSAENQEALSADTQQPSKLCENTSGNMEADCMSEAEPPAQSSSSSSSTSTSQAVSGDFFQPKTLAEVTRVTCIQKAKAWADRHYVSRNAIQRQNRVRHGVQSSSFQLQQPGQRSFSH